MDASLHATCCSTKGRTSMGVQPIRALPQMESAQPRDLPSAFDRKLNNILEG
jgi:hypothetical protein